MTTRGRQTWRATRPGCPRGDNRSTAATTEHAWLTPCVVGATEHVGRPHGDARRGRARARRTRTPTNKQSRKCDLIAWRDAADVATRAAYGRNCSPTPSISWRPVTYELKKRPTDFADVNPLSLMQLLGTQQRRAAAISWRGRRVSGARPRTALQTVS